MATVDVHRPVLLEAALAALAIRPEGAYLDATYGRGGHAGAILERLDERGRLVVVDRDPAAIADARERFGEDSRVRIVEEDFSMLASIAARTGPAAGFDGILLDLGVSSPQLDDPARGFSFRDDGPLDMRMNPSHGPSAAEWLSTVGADELAAVIREFGEERYARRIARAIVEARVAAPIERTGRLAEIVAGAVPRRERDQHPATRTFQAIRIFINRELEALDAALAALPDALVPGGRAAVISFHSLEDRRVKRFFRAAAGGERPGGRDSRGQPLPSVSTPQRLRVIGSSQVPGEDELRANPRARSARLRVAEKLP